MRVLIAEDEYIAAILFKTQIENLGHEVVGITHSGEETILKAKEIKPDIIFMDISMEKKADGISACKRIKEDNGKIKVYFLTAYEKQVFQDQLKDIPYDGFIDKFEFKTRIEEILSP